MTVKLFAFAKRKIGTPAEGFLNHWRHPHGTLAKQIKMITGYIQHRPTHSDRLGSEQLSYDGIAEIDVSTEADAAAFGADPDYVRDLVPDEATFIDRSSLKFMCVTDHTDGQIPPTAADDAADRLWQGQRQNMSTNLLQFIDRPMAIRSGDHERVLAAKLGALRFCFYRPSSVIHGDSPPYHGLRALTWPTFAAFQRGTQSREDEWEQLFGPRSSSFMVVTTGERVI